MCEIRQNLPKIRHSRRPSSSNWWLFECIRIHSHKSSRFGPDKLVGILETWVSRDLLGIGIHAVFPLQVGVELVVFYLFWHVYLVWLLLAWNCTLLWRLTLIWEYTLIFYRNILKPPWGIISGHPTQCLKITAKMSHLNFHAKNNILDISIGYFWKCSNFRAQNGWFSNIVTLCLFGHAKRYHPHWS